LANQNPSYKESAVELDLSELFCRST